MILWMPLALAEPALELRWKGSQAVFHVEPPAGEHVGEAPTRIRVEQGGRSLLLETVGDPEGLGFRLATGPLLVEAELAFCTDGSTTCRSVRFSGAGEAKGRKGSLSWAPLPPPVLPPKASTGAVRLIDFGAVWCPPCNLLLAEVLEDPADAALLAPFVVERVDVDRPESWALKDQYAVGGYPTILAVDAAGNEVDRLVGYPGEVAFSAWVHSLSGLRPLAELEKGLPLKGAEASSAARRLAEAGKLDAARRYLWDGEDGVDLRIARLIVDGHVEDARWLLEHQAPEGGWVFDAIELLPQEPGLFVPLLLTGVDAPAYLEVMAAQQKDAAVWKAAAILLYRERLTGDPLADKGYYTGLADLYADVGQRAEAEKLLAGAIQSFPREFTFHYALGRIRLEAADLPGAETAARAALQYGFGDQRLRAAMLLAKVLKAQGKPAEGKAVLEAILVEIPDPPPDVDVRTRRYRGEIQKLLVDFK
jgi:thiol-disulfide isomerase/thioredoxin/tetratricopeptide (TPR) repeat protein